MAENIPLEINLHQQSAYITIKYENDSYDLTAEYLRVHSPSAEVKGHAPGQEKLQIGKENVSIEKITPVGNYAIQIFFDVYRQSVVVRVLNFEILMINQDTIDWKKMSKVVPNPTLVNEVDYKVEKPVKKEREPLF